MIFRYAFDISHNFHNYLLLTFEQIKMLNGMHILVTNIPTLLRLMDNPLQLFKKTRIQTIVFDEIDSMCDRFGESEVDKIYKSFCAETNIQVRL